MERLPKIKLTEAEKKAHTAVEKRRRILGANTGEKAVADLNKFLAESGLTENDWEALQKKLGKERRKMN